MESNDPLRDPRQARFLERRIEQKGFRPRFAAAVIAAVWLVAIVVFGIVEHLIDPETFDNVWLGMWWATETVTTVGYGDVVPGQTAGQLAATVLMVGGLSLFAVVTGTITSMFVQRAQAQTKRDDRDKLDHKLADLSTQLEEVREQLARLGHSAGQ